MPDRYISLETLLFLVREEHPELSEEQAYEFDVILRRELQALDRAEQRSDARHRDWRRGLRKRHKPRRRRTS